MHVREEQTTNCVNPGQSTSDGEGIVAWRVSLAYLPDSDKIKRRPMGSQPLTSKSAHTSPKRYKQGGEAILRIDLLAARSYRFWDRPQEVIGFGDLWGPSGDHHSEKLSILVICNKNMSFVCNKNTLSKFIMQFDTRIFCWRPPRTSKKKNEFHQK